MQNHYEDHALLADLVSFHPVLMQVIPQYQKSIGISSRKILLERMSMWVNFESYSLTSFGGVDGKFQFELISILYGSQDCKEQFRKVFPTIYRLHLENDMFACKRTKQGIEARRRMYLERASKDAEILSDGQRGGRQMKREHEDDDRAQWTLDGSWSEKDTRDL